MNALPRSSLLWNGGVDVHVCVFLGGGKRERGDKEINWPDVLCHNSMLASSRSNWRWNGGVDVCGGLNE